MLLNSHLTLQNNSKTIMLLQKNTTAFITVVALSI